MFKGTMTLKEQSLLG